MKRYLEVHDLDTPIVDFESGEECLSWLQRFREVTHNDGVAQYGHNTVKHVVVDYNLGRNRMTGLEFIRELRSLGKERSDLKDCVVTVVSVNIKFNDPERFVTKDDVEILDQQDKQFFDAGANFLTKYQLLLQYIIKHVNAKVC